ncbi:MAG: hypothetical protein EHM40_22035, partial [Chloroflexi bacterium]
MAQFDSMYPYFVKTVLPILKQGLPDEDSDRLTAIIEQIAPKSIAFCAAISAGEIQNMEHLSSAAAAISISYWADQSMDRGDPWMLAAVRYLNHKRIGGALAASREFSLRLESLRHIKRLASQITHFPDDLPYVLQAIERDVLGNQAEMCLLSHKFLESSEEHFWDVHAKDVAQTMIDCSGLMSAVAIIYAIYRRRQPGLPSLDEIYSQPELMRLVRETFNSAVRVFDDAGDWETDLGKHAEWGQFNLNIFNQPHPKLLRAFLDYSGISENHSLHAAALTSFALPPAESRLAVSQLFLDITRQQVAALPASIWEHYSLFLTLCKRTLEAGFVNALGDVFLSESTSLSTFDDGFLKLLTPDLHSISSW